MFGGKPERIRKEAGMVFLPFICLSLELPKNDEYPQSA
jgi:hypothetical protein